jgi:hypothetical protein
MFRPNTGVGARQPLSVLSQRTSITIAVVVLVLVSSTRRPAGQAGSAPDGSTSRQTLRVLSDPTGEPVPGAQVRVLAGRTVVTAGETDIQGSVSVPTARAVTVEIDKPLFVPLRLILDDDAARTVRETILRLTPYSAVSGQILDGAGVVALVEQVPNNVAPRKYSAMSEGSGRFRIFGVPPGRYRLAAMNPSRRGGVVTGIVGTGDGLIPEFAMSGGEELDGFVLETLDRGVKVTGIVDRSTLDDSAVIVASLVRLDPPGLPAVRSISVSRDGRFDIPAVLPGRYEIRATAVKPGFALVGFGSARFEVTSQDVQDVGVTLEAPRTSRLSMVQADVSEPARCAGEMPLSLSPATDWPGRLQRRVAISTGSEITVTELLPVLYIFTGDAEAPPGCQVIGSSFVGGTTHRFEVTQAGRVQVSLARGGASPLLVILRDLTAGRTGPMRAFVRAPGGTAMFRDLSAGEYALFVADPVAADSWQRQRNVTSFTLQAGQTRTLTIEGAGR